LACNGGSVLLESKSVPTEGSDAERRGQGGIFLTTHWSVVLAAAERNEPEGSAALEQLCRTYWYPLYAYIRRDGRNAAEAEDLTQGFFAHLLARDFLARVGPQKGKFRSFLLAALRRFLCDQWDRARAVKRGGGAEVLSLDAQEAEERYRMEPVERLDPEKLYERRWVLTLLEQALARLRDESAAAGKAVLFQRLRSFVAVENEVSCAEVAAELGLTESAAKAALHRLRERYREILRDEIARTVASPAELEAEIRYLVMVLSR
jgi:RNA polymerase sigma-70 factor (ECF subfamily)